MTDKDVQQLVDAWEAIRSGPWRPGKPQRTGKPSGVLARRPSAPTTGCGVTDTGWLRLRSVNLDDDR